MEIDTIRRDSFTDRFFDEIGSFVATRNGLPAQHIGYLGDDPADVAAELRELEGDFAFALARDGAGSALVGALGAEWDPEVGRVWLLGPWADSAELMDRLHAALLPAVPAEITEHELYCNVANTAVIAFADRHGFPRRGQNVVMRFDRERLASLPPVTLPVLTPAHHEQFAALHDRAFPGTHAPSAAMLARADEVRVLVEEGTLIGYVALKLRPEYNDAQVEYIAVDESARGRGAGARLLTAALHETFADSRFSHMDLVTGNPVARRLYEKVGFTLRYDMRSFRS